MLLKEISLRAGKKCVVRTASFAVLGFASALAHAQRPMPTVCVEYLPGQTNYLARFGYINQGTTSFTYRPDGSNNYLQPIPMVAGVPGVFPSGALQSAFTILISGTVAETWHLGSSDATAIPALYAQTNNVTPSPVCPVVIEPATLRYTAPGTYNNVFLGQVDSGPAANGVTVSAFSTSTGIAFTNLTYVPADPANPTNTLNPNSIYGTVTVTADTAPSTGVYLQLSTNGIPAASAVGSVKVRLGTSIANGLRNEQGNDPKEPERLR